MTQQGLFNNQMTKEMKDNRYISIVSWSIFYLGVFIIISALIYMIVNLSKADLIIKIWVPFMLSGIVLVFMSQLIKSRYFKTHR